MRLSIFFPTKPIKKPNPNNPKIIEGTTASVFTANLIVFANTDFSFAYSAR